MAKSSAAQYVDLANTIWLIRERQKDYEVGSEYWHNCEVQASIRETRLEKMQAEYRGEK